MDRKRFIAFLLISVAVMIGWEYMMNMLYPDRQTRVKAPTTASAPATAASTPAAGAVSVPEKTAPDSVSLVRGQRISVKTDVFAVEIDSNGADLRRFAPQ